MSTLTKCLLLFTFSTFSVVIASNVTDNGNIAVTTPTKAPSKPKTWSTAVTPPPHYNIKKSPTFWPPLGSLCHRWYDKSIQQTFPQAQLHCRNETSEQRILLREKVKVTDWRTCILWRLKGIVFDGKTPVWRMNMGLRKSLLIIMSGLRHAEFSPEDNEERKVYVETLLHKSAPCAIILDNLVRDKMPTTKWTEFHECVENAWKCKNKKISNAPPPASPPAPPSNWWKNNANAKHKDLKVAKDG